MIQSENSTDLPIMADQGQNGSGTVSKIDVWLTPSDSPDVLGKTLTALARAGTFRWWGPRDE